VLRHVVAWKLAAEDPATKLEQSAEIASRLNALVPIIPQIRSLTVGSNAVEIEGNWDVVLVADYDDVDGLRAYIDNPDHQTAVSYIRSVVAERSAVDFIL
jgi:Stress responsive A/B Barrel Domain